MKRKGKSYKLYFIQLLERSSFLKTLNTRKSGDQSGQRKKRRNSSTLKNI